MHVTTHRFICLVRCGISLASSNPSSLPRDANTLLRYPSTWQIRLLAGWLAELRAECWSQFSRSDYRAQLIVSVCVHYPAMVLCICYLDGSHSPDGVVAAAAAALSACLGVVFQLS